MGYELSASDSGTGDYTPVGTVHLTNNVDHLEDFEFRGRIENHPMQVGQVTKNGAGAVDDASSIRRISTTTARSTTTTQRISTTHGNFAMPRAVVRSIEFEAPVIDVWPPEHHTRILFESPLRTSDPEAYVREVLGTRS